MITHHNDLNGHAPVIALTGGGSGGHLSSVKELKKAFVELGAQVIFLGSTSGQDQSWLLGETGFIVCYYFPVRSVVDRGPAGQAVSLAKIIRAAAAARVVLKKHGARALISVGGYSAAPGGLAALVSGVPLFVHEHNVVMSRLHRLEKPWAAEVFSSYDLCSPARDYPVSQDFFDCRRLRNRVQNVLFLGGSQGARFINDLALGAARQLSEQGVSVAHQTGFRDFDRVRAAYQALNVEADIFAFDRYPAQRMARADLAVTRAGAGTLWELAANGLPALFIPYPHAARNHQYFNALYFTAQGLGWVARQSQARPGLLLSIIKHNLTYISQKLMALIKPGGALRMAEIVMKKISGDH
ncbi:MAG: glycosyltransferase [Deltaproteobacteria bacterium]|nr:glycosyltransferase [Deltaproteobacteria bacterium]